MHVLPVNAPVVEWFLDLWQEFELLTISKDRKRLNGPSKQAIRDSADLLHLNPSRADYNGLRHMIQSALKEYNGES